MQRIAANRHTRHKSLDWVHYRVSPCFTVFWRVLVCFRGWAITVCFGGETRLDEGTNGANGEARRACTRWRAGPRRCAAQRRGQLAGPASLFSLCKMSRSGRLGAFHDGTIPCFIGNANESNFFAQRRREPQSGKWGSCS